MKNFSIILSTVAIIIAAVAVINSSKVKNSGISEEAVAEILSNNPKMIVDALQAYQEQQRAEQEKAAAEAIARLAPEINDSSYAPFIGPKDAKVTVVEFFDFSCGYCKMLAPTIEAVIEKNPDVKFVFKSLSFVSPVSSYQAKGAIAADKQGKFAEFYKEVMGAEGRMSEAEVDEVAKKIGLNFDKFKTDMASEATEQSLNSIAELSSKAQINGVPTVFINVNQVSASVPEYLQKAIDGEK
ncbi:MAG: thioredoxin domain-containing protein [Alphaproteobacteria bacterium]|nr:thioredoxin domain-containing protein [Alphaproteobacteria bacterium]